MKGRCFWSLLAFNGFNFRTSHNSKPPRQVYRYPCPYKIVLYRLYRFYQLWNDWDYCLFWSREWGALLGQQHFCLLKVGSPCSDLMRPLSCPPTNQRGDPGCQQGETGHNILIIQFLHPLKFEGQEVCKRSQNPCIHICHSNIKCLYLVEKCHPDPPLVAILPGLMKNGIWWPFWK